MQIHAKLIEKFADQIDSSNKDGVRAKIVELADEYFRTTAMTMTKTDRERLVESVLDDVLGLGPLEALLSDATITEIMANHPKQIYVEKAGEPVLSATVFESERQMRQVIDRIVSLVGRRVDESTPICDARLKDGSRVNVVIPPIALKGPCLTIRKFAKEKWGPADVVNRFRSSSPELMTFLRSCVRARMNILVSGGTGSGKTTLLNILSSFIPESERLITCEDAAELQLQQPHWIQLESRPPNVEGKGAVPIRELVKSCLRMRPDRIIVGECRGGEALDMLQAMNTGHDGSMSTIHANNPHECLVRLETLVLQAGQDLPVARHSRDDRRRHPHDRPAVQAPRRCAPHRERGGDHRHQGRRGPVPGDLSVPTDRRQLRRQGRRLPHRHRHHPDAAWSTSRLKARKFPSTYFSPPPNHPRISCTDPFGGLDANPVVPNGLRSHHGGGGLPRRPGHRPGETGCGRFGGFPGPSGRVWRDDRGGDVRSRPRPASATRSTTCSSPRRTGSAEATPRKESRQWPSSSSART